LRHVLWSWAWLAATRLSQRLQKTSVFCMRGVVLSLKRPACCSWLTTRGCECSRRVSAAAEASTRCVVAVCRVYCGDFCIKSPRLPTTSHLSHSPLLTHSPSPVPWAPLHAPTTHALTPIPDSCGAGCCARQRSITRVRSARGISRSGLTAASLVTPTPRNGGGVSYMRRLQYAAIFICYDAARCECLNSGYSRNARIERSAQL
jgi:hypothetical protein